MAHPLRVLIVDDSGLFGILRGSPHIWGVV